MSQLEGQQSSQSDIKIQDSQQIYQYILNCISKQPEQDINQNAKSEQTSLYPASDSSIQMDQAQIQNYNSTNSMKSQISNFINDTQLNLVRTKIDNFILDLKSAEVNNNQTTKLRNKLIEDLLQTFKTKQINHQSNQQNSNSLIKSQSIQNSVISQSIVSESQIHLEQLQDTGSLRVIIERLSAQSQINPSLNLFNSNQSPNKFHLNKFEVFDYLQPDKTTKQPFKFKIDNTQIQSVSPLRASVNQKLNPGQFNKKPNTESESAKKTKSKSRNKFKRTIIDCD
eukprot:403340109